jgi:hypothetical protein
VSLLWKLLASVVPVAGAFLLIGLGRPGWALFLLAINLIAWIRWGS